MVHAVGPSQCSAHCGSGHFSGCLQFHWHVGSAQTDSQTGASHATLHEGVLQIVLQAGQSFNAHFCCGQTTTQSGSEHSSRQPWGLTVGQRVWHVGAAQSGSHVSSQGVLAHFHVHEGAQEAPLPSEGCQSLTLLTINLLLLLVLSQDGFLPARKVTASAERKSWTPRTALSNVAQKEGMVRNASLGQNTKAEGCRPGGLTSRNLRPLVEGGRSEGDAAHQMYAP